MSAAMWKAAVPAGQYPDDSGPSMVRQGKAAPLRLSVSARSRAESSVLCRHCRRAAHRARLGVREHRQDEHLGVPEGVPVVTGAGQPLRRDRPLLGPRAGLEHVEETEPDRLLHLRVALDQHVGGVPERVEVVALLPVQPVPAVQPGPGQRRADLVAQRRQRPPTRPAVRQILDHPQLLAGLEHAGDGGAAPSPGSPRTRWWCGPGRAPRAPWRRRPAARRPWCGGSAGRRRGWSAPPRPAAATPAPPRPGGPCSARAATRSPPTRTARSAAAGRRRPPPRS